MTAIILALLAITSPVSPFEEQQAIQDIIAEIEPVAPIEVEPIVIEPVERAYAKACNTTSTFKSWMDYRKITRHIQYDLQQRATTNSDGVRVYEGRIMVAMANYTAGTRLTLHLSSGVVLPVIIGDVKANTNCAHPDGSILEFIVDRDTLHHRSKLMGNVNELYAGTIERIYHDN